MMLIRLPANVDVGAGYAMLFHLLGPKLLLAMGCVKLGDKNCVHLPSVGEQTAN